MIRELRKIALQRPLLRLTIILVGMLLILGCHGRSEKDEPSTDQPSTDQPGTTGSQSAAHRPLKSEAPVDFLATARRMFQIGDFDSAAESAYKALLQDPDSADAILIASEVEAARGNAQISVDLAGSINIQSRLGKRAIDVQYHQLLKLSRPSEAADLILAAVDVMPEVSEYRHRAWSLLNRLGRRAEASDQADALCRAGQAIEQELLSLLRRTDSFPCLLKNDENPNKYFEPGLGMARWFFTQQDYRRALAELSREREAGFQTPAACALYGRLLAETQALEEMPAWYAKCPQEASDVSDYWAALGSFFFDHHQFEASARALLEAVVRDPTDDSSLHRLARVFDALGRPEDGEQFRRRGELIVNTEQDARILFESPGESSARKGLTQKLLELSRPFEVLAWSLSTLPANATNQRAAIANKRAELSRDDSVVNMAAESTLESIDRAQFSLEPAIGNLRRVSPPKAGIKSNQVEQLALPRLVNVAGSVGLLFQWYRDLEINSAPIPIHESVGGAIAVIDYDLDGWPDVYLAQGSGDPPTDACTRSNVLLRNVGSRYQAVTPLAQADDFNYSTGLAAGDMNQDGFTDLFLGSAGHNRLLINNGDGTFRDATKQMGQFADRFTSSLAIADLNGDALPDLFEANYIEMDGAFVLPEIESDGRVNVPAPLNHKPDLDRWFQNKGDGGFQVHEITREVAKPGSSLGIMITDFDSNGSNEIFVGNDLRPNHFLFHSGDNQFRNAADVKGVANGFSGKSTGCMGIASGDFNRDGEIDLHITNFHGESANLYLQTAAGFTDYAIRYGLDSVSLPLVGFGTKAVDFDRNGWLDLIVTNGHIFDLRAAVGHEFEMPPQLMMCHGNRFELVSVDDDSGYWEKQYLGRSMASLDFDRDGSIDFLIGHLDQPVALLRNETQTDGHWIQFELIGTESERDAIGARIVVTAGREKFTHWVTAGDGYFCSDEPVVDFGLGAHRELDKVEVFWPTGIKQAFSKLELGHRYLIVESESKAIRR